MLAATLFSPSIERDLTAAGAPAEVQQLEPFRRNAFFADARALAAGGETAQVWTAPYAELLPAEAQRAGRIAILIDAGAIGCAVLASLLGALFAFSQIRPGLC